MLRELEVRDLGIIDRVRLELPPGFVVLTGETGAGKSLLVQSLQLLAGDRADSQQVRGGAERLLVEASFDTPLEEEPRRLLAELGVSAAGELVVRREVSSVGRSRAWLDDVPVTVAALQRLAPWLLSIHGQHESRGLTDPATHLALLDQAGVLDGPCSAVSAAFAAWRGARERLETQRTALATRRDRLDAIAFQLGEINAARVEAGEEERLHEERAMLRHSERIAELLAVAAAALGGESGAVALARAGKATVELAALGLGLAEAGDELEQARLLTEDAERQLAALRERLSGEPGRLEAVETRLAVLERLIRKYGGSTGAVLDHREALVEERSRLEAAEGEIAVLERAEARAAADYLERAQALSARRGQASASFARDVVGVLGRLGMGKVTLRIAVSPRTRGELTVTLDGREVGAGPEGIDDGELVISPNPGEAPRPLAKIASGGELSRIHLAIRTVLRDRGGKGAGLTLLFDEADAGIGGRVADELGRLLAQLGERDQVFLVTHLPQVAARAASHFVVTKRTAGGRTTTSVRTVEAEERVEELVRMLGGAKATPTARQHARELLDAT
jgi:DNA repair protein RecN (Recombination protein N)